MPVNTLPPIECGENILYDDFDEAKNFMRYFSSVYERDGNELTCARQGLSVLDEIVFDVVDVYALLDKLED